MRNFITILLFFISTFVKSQIIFGVKPGGETGIDFNGKTAVFFGNSITAGFIASGPTKWWTYLFCQGKNSTQDNHGVSSMTMQANPCGFPIFDKTNIPTYVAGTHCAMFIALGINDVGVNLVSMTPALFKVAYTSAITYAINTKGWPPNRIILLNTYHPFSYNIYIGLCTVTVAPDQTRAAAYNSKVQEVAVENGCFYVDINTAMVGLSALYFNVDQLHPNDAGHAFIANYLLSVL